MTVDIILLLILIVCILSGYRKGLILSLCSLLILVVSCLGASVAQQALTPRVVEQVTPQITMAISEKLEEQVSLATENALADAGEAGITMGGQEITLGDLMDLLNTFGLDVEATARNTASEISAPLVAAAAQAMAEAIVEAFAGLLIYLAAFLIIFLLLRTVELGVNAVDRLPVIHTLNHLSGGIVGLVSGAFILVMVMALLTRTGAMPEETFNGPVSGLIRHLVETIIPA